MDFTTGWLSSVFNMAGGLNSLFGGAKKLKPPTLADNELLFAVREPYASVRTQAGIVGGLLRGNTRLTLQSFMPANGVIFSDGIENDFLPFNSGATARVGLAEEVAVLVERGEG